MALKFIDLFAGLGGTRLGFEQACSAMGIATKCVLTSEVKDFACRAYHSNFGNEEIAGDITKIAPEVIPDFDYLLAGFPCQPFSSAGNRKGFLDHRGGLFFTIQEILSHKKPEGFLLENVDGLATHDAGRTLATIIEELEKLGYQVTWKILDSSEFGVPQRRKRIYIVGSKNGKPSLEGHIKSTKFSGHFIDYSEPVKPTEFTQLLSKNFSPQQLEGKSIKDKRGGKNNIHSWDLELKGPITSEQRELLGLLLKKRRSKRWAEAKGIAWMDGMPLTCSEIETFFPHKKLRNLLDDLTKKGYLKFEHPKKRIRDKSGAFKRVPHTTVEKGYNIVSGKLSFPIAHILDPKDFCPTIVATEAGKIAVSAESGVRPITVKEGLLLSGFSDSYDLSMCTYQEAFDLLGNTVMPPVIEFVSTRILEAQDKQNELKPPIQPSTTENYWPNGQDLFSTRRNANTGV